jgi:ABC-type bacteriocin/lantibiotic exporter with double-glycine peptidase domain
MLLLLSLWTERWMVAEPDGSLAGRAGNDHHCAQTTTWSCGPAACVSLLSYLGVDATEGEMARLCRTASYGGTSLFHIARGLRAKLGGKGVHIVKGDPDVLRDRGGLAIVSVYRVHVVAVRFEGDGVVVHDPAKQRPQRMSLADYRAAYGGFAVIAEP